MNFITPLMNFAEKAPTTPGSAPGCVGGAFPMLAIYILIFAALYFFMIRPNSKKKKAEEELKKNINIGDDITTIGGITGKVVAVKDEEVLQSWKEFFDKGVNWRDFPDVKTNHHLPLSR